MRIGVITDAHANLPATVAVLSAMKAAGCEEIIHLGDAIGIGPHPRETLALLLGQPNITLLMGNHDAYFAHSMLDDPPAYMSAGELEHQRWTHAQLDEGWRSMMRRWPLMHDRRVGSTSIRFQHYAITDGDFGPVSYGNVPEELDAAFCPEADIVFFGHHHPRADVQGKARYINPGALGCHPAEGARYVVIDDAGVRHQFGFARRITMHRV